MKSLYTKSEEIPPTPLPTLYVKSLVSWGGPEVAIRMIFQKAREQAPCFLIWEDLDSIIDDSNRSFFLNELDGLENNDGILVIGTTNHLDRLDPGIVKRPSRFDRKYLFDNPAVEERKTYVDYWRFVHFTHSILRKHTVSNLKSEFTERSSPTHPSSSQMNL